MPFARATSTCAAGGERTNAVVEIRANLLDWYDRSHRVLPWRRNPRSRLGPEALAAAAAAGLAPAPADLPLNDFIYYEWVSEVMCQQTQVSRAAEYFARWVARWPTVAALAGASQEEVNEAWAGLGYYRRARYLLDGAKYVQQQLGGAFPTTAKELQARAGPAPGGGPASLAALALGSGKIPGVGEYTSAAIASIACGRRAAVVDGNVIRVLARLRALRGDPRSGPVAKLIAGLAEELVDPERPGDFNQVEKASKREETVAVTVLQVLPPGSKAAGLDAGAFLLSQRPQDGLLADLWEFPSQLAVGGGGASRAAPSPAALRRQMTAHLAKLLGVRLAGPGGGGAGVAASGVDAEAEAEAEEEEADWEAAAAGGDGGPVWEVVERRQLGSLVHVFSHIRQTMVVEKLVVRGELPAGASGGGGAGRPALQWLSRRELEARGLSSGTAKVLKLVQKDGAAGKSSITKFFKPLAAGSKG
eukprot:scaffold4.g4912.t1